MADHKIKIFLDKHRTQVGYPKSVADIIITNQGQTVQRVLDNILQLLPESDVDKIDITGLAELLNEVIMELNEARGSSSLDAKFKQFLDRINVNTSDISDLELKYLLLETSQTILEESLKDKLNTAGGTITGDTIIDAKATITEANITDKLLIKGEDAIQASGTEIILGSQTQDTIIQSEGLIKANISGIECEVYTDLNPPSVDDVGAVSTVEYDDFKAENQIFHDWVSTDLTDADQAIAKVVLTPAPYEDGIMTNYETYGSDSESIKVMAPLRATEDGSVYDELDIEKGEVIRRTYVDNKGVVRPLGYELYEKVNNVGPTTFMNQTSFFVNDEIQPDELTIAYTSTTAGQIAYLKKEIEQVEIVNKEFDKKFDKTGGTIGGDVRIEGSVEVSNKNLATSYDDKMFLSDSTVDTHIKSKGEIIITIAGVDYVLLHSGSTLPNSSVDPAVIAEINKKISDLDLKVDIKDTDITNTVNANKVLLDGLRADLDQLIQDGLQGSGIDLSELTLARKDAEGVTHGSLKERLDSDSQKSTTVGIEVRSARGSYPNLKARLDDVYTIDNVNGLLHAIDTVLVDLSKEDAALKESIRLSNSNIASTNTAMAHIQNQAQAYDDHLADTLVHIGEGERETWNDNVNEVNVAKGTKRSLNERLDYIESREDNWYHVISKFAWKKEDGYYEHTITHNLKSTNVLYTAYSLTTNRIVFLSGEIVDENSISFEIDTPDSIKIILATKYFMPTLTGAHDNEILDARGHFPSLKNRIDGDINDVNSRIDGLINQTINAVINKDAEQDSKLNTHTSNISSLQTSLTTKADINSVYNTSQVDAALNALSNRLSINDLATNGNMQDIIAIRNSLDAIIAAGITPGQTVDFKELQDARTDAKGVTHGTIKTRLDHDFLTTEGGKLSTSGGTITGGLTVNGATSLSQNTRVAGNEVLHMGNAYKMWSGDKDEYAICAEKDDANYICFVFETTKKV